MKSRVGCVAVVWSWLSLVGGLGSVSAQPEVAPGGTVVFTSADGGMVECRRLAPIGCIAGVVTGSADAAGRVVFARSIVPVTGIGIPNYAKATIYNDFVIAAGSTDRVVDVEIDVTFDYFSSFNVAALSKVEGSLSLSVEDITWGTPGIPVAAHTLVSQNRTSDQGTTDVAQGAENNNLSNSNGHFRAKLRRGHTYRLSFSAESLGEVSLLGVARSVIDAGWRRLAVTVDEDEVELLAQHDAAVRGQITAHDSDMKQQLSTHDEDIKELLASQQEEIRALFAQVIRLLNTPQGRRPEFPVKD